MKNFYDYFDKVTMKKEMTNTAGVYGRIREYHENGRIVVEYEKHPGILYLEKMENVSQIITAS